MVSWSIVRVVFCRSIEPVEVPVSEAIVSLEPIFRVPWTSKFTVSAKPPSPLVKSAVVYLSISKVPVPVTRSKNWYSLALVPSASNVKVLLLKLIAVVAEPFELPNINLLLASEFKLGSCNTFESAVKVTVPVKVVFLSLLDVNVAAVPPLKLLFPEPAKLMSML